MICILERISTKLVKNLMGVWRVGGGMGGKTKGFVKTRVKDSIKPSALVFTVGGGMVSLI
jgi:hypothetical protein